MIRLLHAPAIPQRSSLPGAGAGCGEDLVRHVDYGVHRQPVQIGFKQLVGVWPRYGGEEAGLQFFAEGLTGRVAVRDICRTSLTK